MATELKYLLSGPLYEKLATGMAGSMCYLKGDIKMVERSLLLGAHSLVGEI